MSIYHDLACPKLHLFVRPKAQLDPSVGIHSAEPALCGSVLTQRVLVPLLWLVVEVLEDSGTYDTRCSSALVHLHRCHKLALQGNTCVHMGASIKDGAPNVDLGTPKVEPTSSLALLARGGSLMKGRLQQRPLLLALATATVRLQTLRRRSRPAGGACCVSPSLSLARPVSCHKAWQALNMLRLP